MTLGVNITRFRNMAGLTQKDLAEKCEISAATLSSYEASKSVPNVLVADQMALALGMTIDELLHDKAVRRSKDWEDFSQGRPVTFTVEGNTVKGTFHKWSTTHTNNGYIPVGMVEDEEGYIHLVPVSSIKFDSKSEISSRSKEDKLQALVDAISSKITPHAFLVNVATREDAYFLATGLSKAKVGCEIIPINYGGELKAGIAHILESMSEWDHSIVIISVDNIKFPKSVEDKCILID